MDNIIELISGKFEIFLLVFMRMSGIFIIAPIFSRKNVPSVFKLGFAFFSSIIVMNTVDFNPVDFQGLEILLILFKELLIGLIVGFISYMLFMSLYLAGQIIDMQIGFGMVNVLDPQQQIQIPITANYFYIMAILVFLVLNGHHVLIRAVISSYHTVPIGNFSLPHDLLVQIVTIFSEMFLIGLKISSPILATIFLANVLLGILARTMPQMNVFMVGMPLKIIVGIATLIIAVPLYIIALQHIFSNMYEEIFSFLKVLQKG